MANPISGATALTFSFSTQSLRVILRDGEPWFVAADVCDALEHTDTSKAVSRLDDDEKGTNIVRTPSGDQQMLIINEPGLYSLILTSRKPEAKKFKKWVTSEVLPAIRKTGRYVAPEAKPEAHEALTNGQLQEIRRIIYFTVRNFQYDGVWTQAIYFYLRRMLGLPSPYPFNASHVPTLQVELGRMLAIGDAMQTLIREIENEAAKRIFRRGENVDTVVAELRMKAAKTMADIDANKLQVPTWLQQDIAAIANPKNPYVAGLHYGGPEQPDFFATHQEKRH